MRKKLGVLAVSAVLAALVVGSARAIQFGQPDGNNHPQVGLVVFYNSAGNALWRCTGTLISPKRFLTAGHCTEAPAASAQVWFSPGPIPLGTLDGSTCGRSGYPCTGGDATGTPTSHPGWTGALTLPNTHDIGMVVLDTAQPGPYASLAAVGTLDALASGTARKNAKFDLVGYGVQDALPPVLSAQRTRYFGTAQLINTKSALNDGYNVQLTAAPGTGGSLCFGDSGGPVFLAGTTTIVAVNSFVLNLQCMGSGFSYRTDTGDSLAFINSFAP